MTEFEKVLVYEQQATYLPKSASVPVQTKVKPFTGCSQHKK